MLQMLSKWMIVVLSSVTVLTGCADQGGPISKQMGGAALGAVAGTVIGSQIGKGTGRTAAIALGAIGGLLVGGAIGSSLDKVDQMHANQSTQAALETAPSGQTSAWRNPDSGNSGTVTPVRTFQNHGQYCREYTQTVKVGGKVQEAYGTACRQPDGTWQMVQ